MDMQTLDVIKILVSSEDFTTNPKWLLDYDALNSAVKDGRKNIAKVLLNNNGRVNKAVKSPINTPLHHAVELADPELISALLKKKASITALNEEGDSPLHIAFLHKQEKLIDIMLEFIEKDSVFLNPKNSQGLTHLHIACTRSNAKVIEGFLNNGALIEDVISDSCKFWPGYNAFHFAAKFKSLSAIKVLMCQNTLLSFQAALQENEQGKTPLQLINVQLEELSIMASIMTFKGISPFHMACVEEDSKLVKRFLDNKVDSNRSTLSQAKFCTSYSPLHFTTKSANSENVELLLQYGANVNCKNEDGMTPAQLALYNETSESNDNIVRKLYDSTKNKLSLIPDKNGLSFMHLACCVNDLEMVKKFLNKGEDINSKVTYQQQRLYHYTPLHFAIKYGHLDLAKYLIRRRAHVNCGENCVNGTPLHLACQTGHLAFIELLLENGVNVNVIRACDQKTPLHLLIENCSHQILDLMMPCISRMIKLGVNVNAQDSKGNTLLHLACSSSHGMILCVKLLLESGADIDIENNAGHTAFDCHLSNFGPQSYAQPSDYTILYHHVQELKAMGLKINPKNEACCARLFKIQKFKWDPKALDFSKEELTRKQQQRVEVIEGMKHIKITNEVSLYDFMRMGSDEAKEFLTSDSLMELVRKEIPVYGYLLKVQFQRAYDSLALKEGLYKRRAEFIDVNEQSRVSKIAYQ